VARTVDHEHRRELIDRAVDYVLTHGLAELALRPLAAGLGTHAPVLLHHFGSKEELLVQILNGVRERVRAAARDAGATDASGFPAFWAWVSDPARAAFFRTFFEAYAMALRRPDRYASFLDAVVQDWLDDLCPPLDPATATLAVAGVRGLLLDLLATGDRRRVDAAAVRLAATLSR
jgi:AcrR family transcriptional regulator